MKRIVRYLVRTSLSVRTGVCLANAAFLLIPLCVFSQRNDREKFISDLLSQMTLEEKVGQMTQLTVEVILKTRDGKPGAPYEVDPVKLKEAISTYKVGSILNVGGDAQSLRSWQKRLEDIQQAALQERLKIPVLYGIDAIHGNNYCSDAVLFPQQIAMAATFNNELMRKVSEAAAYETRACFIPWTFSPVLDLGRNPVWPRLWETFGEDPFLAAEMGKASIEGFEGKPTDKLNGYQVVSCLKHFLGYSFPLSGHDRTPAWIPERELREYFLPSFAAAIGRGVKTIMVNSAEINGIPVHCNKDILTGLLKKELKFDGLVVTDWQDIKYLYQRHKVAKDYKEAIAMAVNAGIDMSMVPDDYSFTTGLIELVKEGKVPLSRIDDAVRRILRVKYYAGLFDNPVGDKEDFSLFNSPEHNQLSYEAATESIMLLKNSNGLLPLPAGKKILVTGPAANSMRALNGGWSRNWQGDNSDVTEKDKHTILEALREHFKGDVLYAEGAGFDEARDLTEVKEKAGKADIIVLCLGESSYTEGEGNINDLTLPVAQLELAKVAAAQGKPLILVLAEGRPRIVSAIEPLMSAVVLACLPGNYGGDAIADVLTGKVNPSGRLPITYPRYPNSLINYYHKYTESAQFNPNGYNPQWEFGYGLSYSTFQYSQLRLSSDHFSGSGNIIVSVDVTNAGKITGKESVLMFVSDLVASVTPEVKRLRGYRKLELRPGQTKTVSFVIDSDLIAFVNGALKRTTEPGSFKVSIGGLSREFIYQ